MENGALTNDRRAIDIIVQLTAITERFEFREEREWRFFRAPKMSNGDLGISFTSKDLQTIVCPKSCITRLQRILSDTNMNPEIVSAENIIK